MKIVVFEAEERERKAFRELAKHHEVVFVADPLTPQTVQHKDADVITTFIYSKLGTDVISQFTNLKLVATRSMGFDHIDTNYCKAHNISVCTVPSYGSSTVAEHVFALLLTISRRMIEATTNARIGTFSPFGLQGFDLDGKVFGVVGTGRIGQNTIKIAKGFGMKVIAFDVFKNEKAAEEIGFEYVELEHLLAVSDIVSLHVPAMPSTHHMLRDEIFATMKDGAVVINVSRGDLIDNCALINALNSGKIAAFGADALPDEANIREEAISLGSLFDNEAKLKTLVSNHILMRMRNVVVTPHSAFNTKEACDRIANTTVDNITGFVNGTPVNVLKLK